MPIRMPKTDYNVVELRGGLDQISPTLSLKAGVVRDALNFECATTGGYSRIGGYERRDGRAKPSDATYQVLQVVSFTNTPAVADTITGGTSGATGKVIAVGANYVVLTQVSGTFSTENIAVGATPIGTTTTLTASITAREYALFQNLAADVYRALIGKVPGEGPVRGVVGLVISGVDHLYAFRDNIGATSTDLYETSGSGWTKIDYKYEVSFTTGGAVAPAEGTTLTKGGVTTVIRRVMDSSGSWAANTAAGRLVIDAPAGGNFSAGAATIGGVNVTLTGAQTAITMSPGGTFEFDIGNVLGAASSIRIYGCDNINRGFDFDGTTLAPIVTGTTPDTPKHVKLHLNHLMWGILSSDIHSGPGKPYRYATGDGGAEIATGDNITGFLTQPGGQTTGALAIYTRSSTHILYGTSISDWNLVKYPTGSGAMDYTGQNMSQSYVLDQLGVSSLSTSQAFGNFAQSTLTSSIQTFINNERVKAACSSLERMRSQYRLFFSDGYALYITIVNGKLLGCMPVFFPNIAYCAWEGRLANGSGVSYFGDTTGYVHQMDVGSSFDGESIEAYITLNWNAMGSPRILKTQRHASIEVQGNYYADISFGYQLGYGTTELGQPTPVVYPSGFTPPVSWDNFTWDDFVWDGRTLFPTEVDVRGTAENIQVTISSTGDYIYPYTVNSVIHHYTPRRGMR